MGMFDTVTATCPSCGELIKYQSKAGVCELKNYSQSSVPPEVANDLDGDNEACKSCGAVATLFLRQQVPRVAMRACIDPPDSSGGYD